MATRDEGYTLVELVVVVLIFSAVMSLISLSFTRIVASSSQIIKSVETEIGGLIGLELLRVELGLAGFGLPWSLGGARYDGECVERHLVDGIEATNAVNFNDPARDEVSSEERPPRAFVTANDKGYNGSDYLVLKGSALGMTSASRRWSYLNYSSTTALLRPPKSEVELVPGNGDRVIVINSGVREGTEFRDLVTLGTSFQVAYNDPLPEAFQAKTRQESYFVYGISPATDSSAPSDNITFPFNRADYYIGPPAAKKFPRCADGSGSLYRSMITQTGAFEPFPVLDCVADLQVVFMLPSSNDGTLVATSDISLPALAALAIGQDPAATLRDLVREVRVYILAQQGKFDPGYSYPVARADRALVVGDRVWSQEDLVARFGRDWRHYHWKVFTIAVQPRNLQ